MTLLNKLLKPFGLKAVSLKSPTAATPSQSSRPAKKIVPLERNRKETLDKLWSDDAFKQTYENNHQSLYDQLMGIVLAEGLLPKSASVIDVGCGPGFFLAMIEKGGHEGAISGCDFSDEAIRAASKRCSRAKLFVHDIYQDQPSRHDVLFCMETIEHLLHPGRALARLLASADTVIITVPEGREDRFRGHINFWSPESWEVFCQENAGQHHVTTRLFRDDHNLLAIFQKR